VNNIILSTRNIDDFIADVANEVVKRIELHGKVESPKNHTEEFLTIQQVSKLLDVSLVTLHKWKKQGKIKFYRFGTRIRFKKSDILNCKR
jgi:excisionase family DNA binding protein